MLSRPRGEFGDFSGMISLILANRVITQCYTDMKNAVEESVESVGRGG